MSRKHQFIVEVEFADKIYDDSEIGEVAKNILDALVYKIDNSGISPDKSETFTKRVAVMNSVINVKLEKTIY
jgi:hypothetical protein